MNHRLPLICTLLVPQSRSVSCVYKWLTFLCTAASFSLKFDFCVFFSCCTLIRGKDIYTNTSGWTQRVDSHTGVHTHTRMHTHVWGRIFKHLHPKCLLMHPKSFWQVNCSLVPQVKSQNTQSWRITVSLSVCLRLARSHWSCASETSSVPWR